MSIAIADMSNCRSSLASHKEIMMAKEPDSGKALKTNALVSRLLEAGSENAVAFTGFVAPSRREGHIKLIFRLNDLSGGIEIAESDIVATADLPRSSLGAVAVWVRRDAVISQTNSTSAQGAAFPRQNGALADVRRAGLRMKVRSQARDTCTCFIICDGTQCVPCTCQCLAQVQ